MHYIDWPMTTKGYELSNPIGYGSFGTVHSAYVTDGPHVREKVAIKIVELEQFINQNLEEIRKEIQIMRLSSHPNILSYHVCFITSTQLWMIMPIMDCGSMGGILKYLHPNGFQDENMIASILKEVLQALMYFHDHNQIHRDVKASNILLSRDGRICLGDFGVSSKLAIGKNARTFTGSPCWMAPEVIDSNKNIGYDFKADIWSFGITAIELAKGSPPYIEYPPMKIILLVKNSDPPQLGKDEDFDSSFKEIVNLCLQKDPTKRPTAEFLLKKKYFNKAKGTEYILNHLVPTIPPIENFISYRSSGNFMVRDRINSESDSWDFNVSSGNVIIIQGSRNKNEDPLAVFGTDEDDPLDEIKELDD